MEKLYFTFGSDPRFPYQRGDYVVAVGKDRHDCVETYRKRHPDRPGSECVNCADMYTAAEWEKNASGKDMALKEVIVSDTAYGVKPEGFDPIWLFVPEKHAIVYLQKGAENGLTPWEAEKGNKDYITISRYHIGEKIMDEPDLITHDGNTRMLLACEAKDRYGCMADAVPDVMDYLYKDFCIGAQMLAMK